MVKMCALRYLESSYLGKRNRLFADASAGAEMSAENFQRNADRLLAPRFVERGAYDSEASRYEQDAGLALNLARDNQLANAPGHSASNLLQLVFSDSVCPHYVARSLL